MVPIRLSTIPGVDRRLRIGILAIQGDFREHADVLGRLGAETVEVRKPDELEGLDGLVIPGGESTSFMRLMRLYGLDEALRRFAGPVLGTCAGMIVLDRAHLGLVDLEVERNAYGRQPASFEADLELDGEDEPLRGIFIRAPRVRDVGADVDVLAEHGGVPVLLRDGRYLVASFHPELTDDTRVHERFLQLVEEESVPLPAIVRALPAEHGGARRRPRSARYAVIPGLVEGASLPATTVQSPETDDHHWKGH
jgi:pyridoxal 5'-phosphate synthase pdxT subunit